MQAEGWPVHKGKTGWSNPGSWGGGVAQEPAVVDSNRGNGTEGNEGAGSGTVQPQGTRMEDGSLFPDAASPAVVEEGDSALILHRVGDGCYRRCLRCFP